MQLPIHTSEAIVDRALDLIRRYTEYKKETHLLVALQEKYNKTIRQPDLSKSKTLQKGKHGYEKRKGDDWVSVEKRQEIADVLCHVLLTEADIVFEDGLFRQYETNETWGKLTETSDPKRPRPGFEPTFIPVAYEEIFEAIKTARKVRVLHTYINATEIFCNNCEKAILKNGCTFEIMLLEPFCDALRLRIKGLLNTLHWGENIESKSKENYRALSALASKYPEYFTFRTYNELPGFTFYQIDQKIYIGLQWYQKQSHEGYFYSDNFDETSAFHQNINTHFNQLWQAYSEKKWTHELVGYLLRDGEEVKLTLQVDIQSLEVRMVNTPSGINFSGFLTIHDDGFSSIYLHTLYDSYIRANQYASDKRTALIMSNLNSRTIQAHDAIFVGLYCVDTIYHQIRANTLVMMPKENAETMSEEKEQLLFSFLKANHTINSTSEISIHNIHSWWDLEQYVKGAKR